MTSPPRLFTSYHLPLPRRRPGPPAALALAAHLALAALVLWRGTELLAPGAGGAGPRGGGGGTSGQRAVTWFNLPPPSAPRMLEVPPAPVIVVPTVVMPDPVPLDVAPVTLTPQAAPAAPAVATVQTGTGGQGPGSGGGQGTGTGSAVGADAGPGSGGAGGYIFPAFVKGVILPAECARGEFVVRFWVEADGRVSRVEVNPPPRDAGCRREMMERMRAYQFRPATTRDGQPVASIFQIRLVH